ncbi:glycosyltransferase family 2 protein [Gillisia sp. Q332]|uniref:glycosyltransferase family 2 protein n=1 Tax=Gillisia xinjiangensis TaxID=3384765 RepID=UPI0039196380
MSIIIPTYNRAHFLGETLEAVIAQTYQNWECIVIDDGSYDNTEEIISSYSDKDQRIKFYPRPATRKKGASACRNFGLEKSKGELIQFLDSDDLLANDKLEKQVKLFKPDDLTLLTCKWGGFEESSNLTKRFKYKYNSYRNFKKGANLLNSFGNYNEYFPSHVYLTPKILIEKSGLWNESLTNNDDAEFFSRVILNATKIIFSPEASAYYRYDSADKLSELNSEEKVKSAITSWKLIESHLREKYPYGNIKYVRTGKLILYNAIIKAFPAMVSTEREFFAGRKDYNTYFYQFLKKFKVK